MTSKERLIAYQRVLQESGIIAWVQPPPDQMIELQVMHHPKKEVQVLKETNASFCTRVSQLIQQYF
jgi:hypothetical protein